MNLNQTRTHCKSIFQQGGRGERSVDWTSRRLKNLLEGDARSETEAGPTLPAQLPLSLYRDSASASRF